MLYHRVDTAFNYWRAAGAISELPLPYSRLWNLHLLLLRLHPISNIFDLHLLPIYSNGATVGAHQGIVELHYLIRLVPPLTLPSLLQTP